MNIQITLRVLAHRYYQTDYINDYYELFNDEEKNELKKFIETSDIFRDNLKYYISNNGEYNGNATIKDIHTIEKDNKLFIIVDAKFTNEDNYTADKIKKIIIETVKHYLPCASIGYSKIYYYTYNHEKNSKEDHEHDYNNCGIRLCDKNESKESDYYDFNILIDNIEIENENYYNKYGTNQSNYKRKCKYHNYYLYIYDDDDIIRTKCLSDEDMQHSEEDIKSNMVKGMQPIERGSYNRFVITNNNHDIICESVKS